MLGTQTGMLGREDIEGSSLHSCNADHSRRQLVLLQQMQQGSQLAWHWLVRQRTWPAHHGMPVELITSCRVRDGVKAIIVRLDKVLGLQHQQLVLQAGSATWRPRLR